MLALTEGISDENMKAIYADPYIARVGHDHRPAAPIVHPQVTYLSAWVSDRFAGAFMIIRYAIDYELHALLFKWAIPWSRKLGRMCIAWAFDHPIHRVTALVIDGLDAAKNYCLKLGFKHEGIRRHACMQNGVPKDVHILGMLRGEQ